MTTVKHAPRRAPKVTTTVQGLAALHELGQRCAALEREAVARDDTLPEARELVAIVRKVVDLCFAAARGCVTNDPIATSIEHDPDAVAGAMRHVIEAIARARRLGLTTDADEAWALLLPHSSALPAHVWPGSRQGYGTCMSEQRNATDPPNEGEEFIEAQPDRMPTPDEEAAAERGASQVDTERTAAHEQEMLRRGANVKGEGQIE